MIAYLLIRRLGALCTYDSLSAVVDNPIWIAKDLQFPKTPLAQDSPLLKWIIQYHLDTADLYLRTAALTIDAVLYLTTYLTTLIGKILKLNTIFSLKSGCVPFMSLPILPVAFLLGI